MGRIYVSDKPTPRAVKELKNASLTVAMIAKLTGEPILTVSGVYASSAGGSADGTFVPFNRIDGMRRNRILERVDVGAEQIENLGFPDPSLIDTLKYLAL